MPEDTQNPQILFLSPLIPYILVMHFLLVNCLIKNSTMYVRSFHEYFQRLEFLFLFQYLDTEEKHTPRKIGSFDWDIQSEWKIFREYIYTPNDHHPELKLSTGLMFNRTKLHHHMTDQKQRR